MIERRLPALLGVLALGLVTLALLRPLDHDESQYVAAAVLSAHGWLPYAYGYLQTPLQPLLFAPLAWGAGKWTWPALRVVNALLGAAAVAGVWRAARVGGAGTRPALIAAVAFASCDILLFSVGTARNDALPAASLAWALPLALHGARGQATRGSAAMAGLLLASAAAAKISYAIPALAYGLYALVDRRHRPGWILLGAAPVAALVAVLAALSPQAFLFEAFGFPAYAPAEYYLAAGRGWKLSWTAKAIDSLKFLALGAALPALGLWARDRRRAPAARLLDVLIVAGIIAALLPAPTWRQYWLPAIVPLFIRLALTWERRRPRAAWRIVLFVFGCAGLAPSIEAIIGASRGVPLVEAMRQGDAVRVAMDQATVAGPVATLSPQFLPATGRLPDARFAAGPFYFRSRDLLPADREGTFDLVSRDRLDAAFTVRPPEAILTGGEGPLTSGDVTLDRVLAGWATEQGYRETPVAGGRFRLFVRPR